MKKYEKIIGTALLVGLFFLSACSGGTVSEITSKDASTVNSTASNNTGSTASEEKSSKMNIELKNYLKNEYDETLQSSLKYITEDGFSYIFMTDMHVDYNDVSTEIINQCNAAVLLANELKVDCIVLGGDIIHGCASHDSSVEWLNRIADIFSNAECPTLTARGNHDSNPYHSKGEQNKTVPEGYIISDGEWFNAVLNERLTKGVAVHDSDNPVSSYYYADFKDSKTRAIFLDPFDFPIAYEGEYLTYVSETWNKLSDRQMVWLASEALGNVPDGFEVAVFCHSPVYKLNEGTFKNASDVRKILKAYNNKSAASLEAYGIDVDYSSVKAKISLCHFGHTHVDGNGFDTDTNMLYLNTGHAKTIPAYANNGGSLRERGAYTEALFDVVTVSKSGAVNRIRFGAGIDEEYSESNTEFGAFSR